MSRIHVTFLVSERVGFEPTVTFATLVFKTNTFNHSDTSPYYKAYQKESIVASHSFVCKKRIPCFTIAPTGPNIASISEVIPMPGT